jgi:hypothetical protein
LKIEEWQDLIQEVEWEWKWELGLVDESQNFVETLEVG